MNHFGRRVLSNQCPQRARHHPEQKQAKCKSQEEVNRKDAAVKERGEESWLGMSPRWRQPFNAPAWSDRMNARREATAYSARMCKHDTNVAARQGSLQPNSRTEWVWCQENAYHPAKVLWWVKCSALPSSLFTFNEGIHCNLAMLKHHMANNRKVLFRLLKAKCCLKFF